MIESLAMSGTITISGGSVRFHFIPANIKEVYDFSTRDTLLGGAGSTTYHLYGNTLFLGTGGHGSSKIYADGKDTVYAGSGAVTVLAGSHPLDFVGGTGPAHVDLTTGSASLFGGSGPITVDGGSGTLTFDDKASKGHDFFKTDTGKAHVTLGGGTATVQGGTGASTVTAGTGRDVFEFIAGHGGGTEVIKDYSAHKDKIDIRGHYTAPPTEKLTPGGLVITLTDGTQVTHITLSDFHHKINL